MLKALVYPPNSELHVRRLGIPKQNMRNRHHPPRSPPQQPAGCTFCAELWAQDATRPGGSAARGCGGATP
eukprot:COSAG02_NODE_1260_length_13563_cov_28.883764_1_plen_70_part_00